MIFRKETGDPTRFFEMLPKDWQDEIVPFWEDYKLSSDIFVIEENHQILGGGIVFTTCPPDIQYYKEEAEKWFKNGYDYLGFIFISEDKRNMNLGSFWLEALKKQYPQRKYWLLIEDAHLHHFYLKNNFIQNKTIPHNGSEEWLYAFKPL